MNKIYTKTFSVTATDVDRFDRLKPSCALHFLQEAAGDHSTLLEAGRDALKRRGLFWAVIRHRVQITALPKAGQQVRVETWPMPTTRSAYPRSAVMRDAQGNELLRSISLWVLMDPASRRMVLPGKSGVEVLGTLRGGELAVPGSLVHLPDGNATERTVRFSDLDWNGHMNNCRYLDWVTDLLPSEFHRSHSIKDFSVCYLNECRENDRLQLRWLLDEQGCLEVGATRKEGPLSTAEERVFSAKMLF